MTGGDHRDCKYYFEDEDRFKCRKGHACYCRYGDPCSDYVDSGFTIRNISDFITGQEGAIEGVYDSPITAIVGQMETQMEGDCLKVVQSYGFDVNAEELKKALAYDREQYDKGYADARRRYKAKQGAWIKHTEGYNVCPFCNNKTAFSYPFCPYCGARMVSEMKEGAYYEDD